MRSSGSRSQPVRAGDVEGLGSIYSDWGGLVTSAGEDILKQEDAWELNIRSPWRRILPKTVFEGYAGDVSSKLYVTTRRIVLVRDIDVWRQLKSDLTPLGLPAAAAEEKKLKKLKASGARQYCEIWPASLRVVKLRRKDHPRSWMSIHLVGSDGRQYALTIWKTRGSDSETLSLLESQFKR